MSHTISAVRSRAARRGYRLVTLRRFPGSYRLIDASTDTVVAGGGDDLGVGLERVEEILG